MSNEIGVALGDSSAAPALTKVILAVAEACREISELLRSSGGSMVQAASGENRFGDQQLRIDLAADKLIFQHLKRTKCVQMASSEESASEVDLGGDEPYSVAFDPLDGSSVIGTNFSVGTIFGVWNSDTLKHVSGKGLHAAGFAVYGPRTTFVLAVRSSSARVMHFELVESKSHGAKWTALPDLGPIKSGKLFAPANLRAAADHRGYNELVTFYMSNKYTLRYTGALVPDVYQVLVKGQGIFVNPTSAAAPAKLRVLYEVAPIAFVMEQAGAAASDGKQRILDIELDDLDQRCGFCVGSVDEVQRCESMLQSI